MDKPIFAKRLVERRNLKSFTQQKVADLTGLSRARLNNYEQGIREPDIDTTIKLADFFGCTTDYLLGKVDQPYITTMESGVRNMEYKRQRELGNNVPFEKSDATSHKPAPPQLSSDELELIEKYRRMKDEDKDTLHKVANHISPDEQAAVVGK